MTKKERKTRHCADFGKRNEGSGESTDFERAAELRDTIIGIESGR